MLKIARRGTVLIALIGLLLGAGVAQADLKATAVVYAWDEVGLQFVNSNATVYFDGGWVSFMHELNFDKDIYPTVCGGTQFAGEMEYGLYYIDNAPAGAAGFQQTQNWKLVACDRDGDGDFDGADRTMVPPTAVTDYIHPGSFSVLSVDVVTGCSTGNCQDEIVTTLLIDLDDDCDGVMNADIPAGGICFYAEAQKPGGEGSPFWGGPLQARISTGGGDKTINFNPLPTVLSLSSFTAYAEGGQVVVEWQTTAEIGTVGFYLFRMDELTGGFRQINDQLLPGLLVSHQGGAYRYVDHNAPPSETLTYMLVEVEAKGRERVYGPFTVTLGEDGAGTSRGTVAAYSRKAHGVSAAKKARISAAKAAKDQAKALKKERKGDQIKIGVSERGLTYVSASDIAQVMGSAIRQIKDRIEKGKLALSTRGQPVAYIPAEDSSGMYFYGEGIESIYTDENVYWLEKGDGLLVEEAKGKGPGPASGAEIFTETIHLEKDQYPLTVLFDDPEADFWMWEYIIAGYPGAGFAFSTDGVTPGGAASLRVLLKGFTDTEANPDHHVVVSLNGTEIGSDYWNGTVEHEVVLSFDQSLLNEGENTIEVSGLLDTGAPYSIFYVDSFDLTYGRSYQAVDNKLLCRGDGNGVVTIAGFTEPAIYLLELSDPLQPQLVTATTVDQQGTDNYRVSFTPTDSETLYFALTADATNTPLSLVADTPSQWKRKQNRAEYVVIAPSELKGTAQGLAEYRRGTGLASVVVELEDIYDEFNDGITSPQAVKAFLSYAYNTWLKAPRYVVLVGDGTYDYKDNQGYGDNLVPPLLVNTPYGLFASDNRFVDVAGDDGVPEMAIGRLPVMTAEELETAIGKIMVYESGGGSEWTDTVLMVADNADAGGNFPMDSDEVAAIVPDAYTAERIYLSEHTVDEARQLLLDGINNGALVLNYIGHAGPDRLAQEGMLLTGDVASLANSDRLPVVTAMTCLAGRFAFPGYDTLSESLVLHEGGGAIAVWAPTGLSMNNPAVFLDTEFFRAAFEDGEKVVGQSILRALEAYAGQGPSYMMYIYNLLGDPALKMK